MSVLTNERYNTYQTGFSYCRLGNDSGMGLCGAGGAQGGQKNVGDLGVRSKVKCH